ncbi:MAG: alginate export family protein [Deltaproteobacteria bacterium]|nr:alginate export family protein [Deltaproteobacteria bacterium]MCL4874227.1 alginate export family protein [bacterium]
MKRILLSVFAAAVAVAWTVPASAADVTFGGEVRVRGEWRDNVTFVDNTSTQSFIGQRVRLTANAQASDDISFKVTLQDTRNWGAAQAAAGGPNLTDSGDNTLDLHESYVNITNLLESPVSLRIGRQELSYGDERLIGTFGWSNNGRSFDAVKAMVTTDLANVDIFASKIRESNPAGGTVDNDQDFYGIYATTKAVPNNTLDLYLLLLRDGLHTTAMIANNSTFGTITGSQKLYTIGARLAGSAAGLDYTVELPYQFGEIGNTDIQAWALAAKAGYTIPGAPMNLRLGAEYNYATGDDDTTAGSDSETFSNLFPTNHNKLGYMDLQGWRNVSAWNLNLSADVSEKLRVYAAYWDFRRAETTDHWYSAGQWNNAPAAAGPAADPVRNATLNTSGSKKVGSEVDLVATYKYNNNVAIEAGLSRFFVGDFVEAGAGANNEDQDWAYLQVTAKF